MGKDSSSKNSKVEDKEKITWKSRSSIPLDMEKLLGMTFKDKVYHLAISGWRIEVETRSGIEYIYAIKYVDRKKRRIYLGKREDQPDL
jgi:hypothetical protein